MTRFAILESNSGYVWGVVDAENALDACSVLDREIGADRGEGAYESAGFSDLNATRGVYDVRTAPVGFDVPDGQDEAAIETVNALPRVGVFGWESTE